MHITALTMKEIVEVETVFDTLLAKLYEQTKNSLSEYRGPICLFIKEDYFATNPNSKPLTVQVSLVPENLGRGGKFTSDFVFCETSFSQTAGISPRVLTDYLSSRFKSTFLIIFNGKVQEYDPMDQSRHFRLG